MKDINLTISFPVTDRAKSPIIFELYSGQVWYLSSDSGLFITNLFEWLEGRRFLPGASIALKENGQLHEGLLSVNKYIEIVGISSTSKQTGEYYQQRYQATENDDIIKLKDFLELSQSTFWSSMLNQMGLDKLMHESINMLSTGEFRKACIIKAAQNNPSIMFIEDPYPGLDKQGRKLIDQLIEHLSNEGTGIVIVGSGFQPADFSTYVMFIQKEAIIYSGIKQNAPVFNVEKESSFDFAVPANNDMPFNNAFQLVDVSVRYDNRLILDQINWTVAKGEKWQLAGNNGSGKSLLLSLVFADNPQVYCNDVSVFDRRRGTGESIWEVKDNIGFYSSEMFRYFNKTRTVEESIRSIVFQNPWKKKVLQQNELQFQADLLSYFNLSEDRSTPLHALPAAKQRVVLLIGVLLRNAPLLILDEPFQYFDQHLTARFLRLIDVYAKDKTLVFVTHNQREIPECINKWYKLSDGKGVMIKEYLENWR